MKGTVTFEVPPDPRSSWCAYCGNKLLWVPSPNDPHHWIPLDGRTVEQDEEGVQRAEAHWRHCGAGDPPARSRDDVDAV